MWILEAYLWTVIVSCLVSLWCVRLTPPSEDDWDDDFGRGHFLFMQVCPVLNLAMIFVGVTHLFLNLRGK